MKTKLERMAELWVRDDGPSREEFYKRYPSPPSENLATQFSREILAHFARQRKRPIRSSRKNGETK
jgi:hypothetical protein